MIDNLWCTALSIFKNLSIFLGIYRDFPETILISRGFTAIWETEHEDAEKYNAEESKFNGKQIIIFVNRGSYDENLHEWMQNIATTI